MNALLQAGLKIYGYPMGYQNITVKALIELLLKDILPQINQANVPSHSGIGHRQRNGRR